MIRQPFSSARYRVHVELAIDGLVLLVLTLLVWGLHPFTRGIRFGGDDVNFLFTAWQRIAEPLVQQLLGRYPLDGSTRSLAFWPFVLATQSSVPVIGLQLFYGAVWLLNGVAIASLARVLWPRSRLAPLIAGCLMVTATSDFMTGSVVYGPHLLGIALFFFGTAQLLRSAEQGHGIGRAISAALLLTWSFFTVEYTYPAVPLLPCLVWLHARPGWSVRSWRVLAVLAVSFLPASAMLVRGLLRSSSHATEVLVVHVPLRQWLPLFVRHVAHNFWPLAWAFRSIPSFYDNYADMFSPVLVMTLASLGTALACWRFRHHVRHAAEADFAWLWHVVLLAVFAFVAMVAVNAAATNPGGAYYMRSHFVSRGWASLGLALLLAGMAQIRPLRLWAAGVFGVFVFFGVWGGIERQSYLLAYGMNERRELASLIEAVPGVDPAAYLLVIQPPGSPTFIAANNPNTISFLYGDLGLWNRVVMAANSGYEYSRVDGDRAGRIRVLTNATRERFVDPQSCIVVFYSGWQERFVRLDEIPAGMLRGSESFFTTYRPQRWLRPAPAARPNAIRDFLALGEASDRPRRKFPPQPSILSVAGMEGQVQVDSLAPFALEPQYGGSIVWLGAGRAQGYSSLLWARHPIETTLTLQVAPGSTPLRDGRLVTRLTRSNRVEQVSDWPFEAHRPTYEVALDLGAGANILEVWLEGATQASVDPARQERILAGLLERMVLRVGR